MIQWTEMFYQIIMPIQLINLIIERIFLKDIYKHILFHVVLLATMPMKTMETIVDRVVIVEDKTDLLNQYKTLIFRIESVKILFFSKDNRLILLNGIYNFSKAYMLGTIDKGILV